MVEKGDPGCRSRGGCGHHCASYSRSSGVLGKETKEGMKDATPFVLRQAEHFVSEVELFLASGLNIKAYDKVCMQNVAGMSTPAE
ncbi:tripartite motif-containing protein 40-like [Iris pallida]|uniref:Tripartite motif-containing protein 40-like n=1 Tax=Iris pallida TaxID=29817 RepID=A0AAX6FHT1_IRIPA|nr:tripartite motif-containing protein 40-like [Iris pallida]